MLFKAINLFTVDNFETNTTNFDNWYIMQACQKTCPIPIVIHMGKIDGMIDQKYWGEGWYMFLWSFKHFEFFPLLFDIWRSQRGIFVSTKYSTKSRNPLLGELQHSYFKQRQIDWTCMRSCTLGLPDLPSVPIPLGTLIDWLSNSKINHTLLWWASTFIPLCL